MKSTPRFKTTNPFNPQDTDVKAVFLAQFDVTSGYKVVWSAQKEDAISLDGVEFKSFPSGLHSVASDVVLFVHPKNKQGELLYGLSVYQQNGLEEFASSRSQVKMFSLGILVQPKGVDWKPSAFSCTWKYLPAMESLLSQWLESDQDYQVFEQLLAPIHSSNSTSHYDHMILGLAPLAETLGPLLVTSWRLALLRKKMIFCYSDSIESLAVACYCISVLSAVPQDLKGEVKLGGCECWDRLQTISCLYNVGISDIDMLDGLIKQQQHSGFVASTTDSIILDKGRLYDFVIDLSSDKPFIKNTQGKTIKATQRDLSVFKSMQREFQLSIPDSWKSSTEAMSWRQLFWNGFKWWASAGEETPVSRLEEVREVLQDGTKLEDDFLSVTNTVISMIGCFQKMTTRLFSAVVDLINNTDEGETAFHKPTIWVQPSDLDEMGLDPYCSQDREFVVDFIAIWFEREAKVGTCVTNLCC